MAVQHDSSRSFTVNTAMSAFRRVSVSSNGAVDMAAIGVIGVGVIQEDTDGASYSNPKVRLYQAGSLVISVTGVPVTAGNVLYAVTNGQVAPTSGGVGGQIIGVAVEGSSNNGDCIEVIPNF